MNPEIKAQWVAALRSGEYKQGAGWLNRGDEYCCLGVLCELAAKAGVVQRHKGQFAHAYGDGKADTYLPSEVVEWARVRSMRPAVDGEPLDKYNDGNYDAGLSPHTFTEIADLIEEHL